VSSHPFPASNVPGPASDTRVLRAYTQLLGCWWILRQADHQLLCVAGTGVWLLRFDVLQSAAHNRRGDRRRWGRRVSFSHGYCRLPAERVLCYLSDIPTRDGMSSIIMFQPTASTPQLNFESLKSIERKTERASICQDKLPRILHCKLSTHPSICRAQTTLFRVPQCFELGPDSFHEDDFTVDCSSGPFYTAVAFALIMIVAVPIGVPLCFLWLMSRAKSALPNGKPNTTLLGGAKLCSDDMDDDQDRYGFLCRDLKPEYWYYEST
jgi:hypothetical protein